MKKRWVAFLLLLALFVAILAYPQHPIIPVAGASKKDWNRSAFWYKPLEPSTIHKGLDIFAPTGTAVVSAVPGLVVFAGYLSDGGHAVIVLTSNWRLHYYAQLKKIDVSSFSWLFAGEKLGEVGASDNMPGRPSHLHYAVISLVPLPWRITNETEGWKLMFYLDPGELLTGIPRKPAGR